MASFYVTVLHTFGLNPSLCVTILVFYYRPVRWIESVKGQLYNSVEVNMLHCLSTNITGKCVCVCVCVMIHECGIYDFLNQIHDHLPEQKGEMKEVHIFEYRY